MINYMFSLFQDPKKGFDPVPFSYAIKYFEEAFNGTRFDIKITEKLNQFVDLKKKNVLDLGAGPGQYTKYFIEKGANTHYHDISNNYITLFKEKFPELKYAYSLGYLEHFEGSYDLIFNNVCFNYGMSDKKLIKKIINGLNPNGIYFGILGNENIYKQKLKNKMAALIQFYMNDFFGIKIGHPFTSKKRIKKLFSSKKCDILTIEDFKNHTLVVIKKK
jgi:2-polyprenyl-3-methyl-5-hydroxy-6-metoxy-1,4-benzoquinol methylase